MGSIFKRGNIYWIKFYRNGKAYRESAKTKKKMVAQKLLEKRTIEVSQGKEPGLFEKVTFKDLADNYLMDYQLNQKKSEKRAEICVKHLSEYFSGMNVPDITTLKINQYIKLRLQDSKQNATINRELSALKRMLNLGARQTPPLVDRVPYIPMLKENNTREGFFEHKEYLAVHKQLPDYLKNFCTFAYKTGWRSSEIANIIWKKVDRDNGIVRLETNDTKNSESRIIYLDEELKSIIDEQWQLRKTQGVILPYVFLNSKCDGKIQRFDKSWSTACQNAKIGKRFFHDFRRTAVRNMVRSGIPEVVAMKISGHKTKSVFDRYNITSESDLKDASVKLASYLDLQGMGTISGTVEDFSKKSKL